MAKWKFWEKNEDEESNSGERSKKSKEDILNEWESEIATTTALIPYTPSSSFFDKEGSSDDLRDIFSKLGEDDAEDASAAAPKISPPPPVPDPVDAVPTKEELEEERRRKLLDKEAAAAREELIRAQHKAAVAKAQKTVVEADKSLQALKKDQYKLGKEKRQETEKLITKAATLGGVPSVQKTGGVRKMYFGSARSNLYSPTAPQGAMGASTVRSLQSVTNPDLGGLKENTMPVIRPAGTVLSAAPRGMEALQKLRDVKDDSKLGQVVRSGTGRLSGKLSSPTPIASTATKSFSRPPASFSSGGSPIGDFVTNKLKDTDSPIAAHARTIGSNVSTSPIAAAASKFGSSPLHEAAKKPKQLSPLEQLIFSQVSDSPYGVNGQELSRSLGGLGISARESKSALTSLVTRGVIERGTETSNEPPIFKVARRLHER